MDATRGRRRATLGLAFVSFLCTGLPGAALGVLWPTMRSSLDRSLGDLGVVFVIVTVGFGAAALTHGAVVRHLGPGRSLAAGMLLSGLGTLGYCSGSWALLLVGAFAAGLGAGTMESGLNSHVSVVHGPRAINVMHGAFGVGATTGPLVATVLLDADLPWQAVFAAVAVVDLALAVGYWLTRAAWVGVEPALRRAATPRAERARFEGRARVLLVATLATFVAYVALETAVGQWSFTLLSEARGVPVTTAGLVVSGFWAALTLGRFVIGALGTKLTSERVLDLSIPGAVLATGAILVGGSSAAAVAVVVCGLFLAGIFPALVALTPRRFGARLSSVMGWQLAAASIGVGAGPALAAVAVEAEGPEASAPVLVALAVAMAASYAVVRVSEGRRVPAAADGTIPTRERDVATAR